jgi:hypothetical protein
MSLKQRAATCLMLLHLLSVAAFIWTDLPERAPAKLSAALVLYKNVSGSFRDYTFFAPSVGSDYKAAFLLEDANRRSRVVNFLTNNPEADFRYRCIISSGMRSEAGRDLFAQSWAALVLGGNPDASKVTVAVKRYSLPTMEAYRQGQRPQWQMVYVGEFMRRNE